MVREHLRLIKICGITRPEDALLATSLGADRIGIILCRKARRRVSLERAQDIAEHTRQGGGIAVAVFVDASAQDIRHSCQACGIQHIQLHGANAGSLANELSGDFAVTMSIGVEASRQVPPPAHRYQEQERGEAEYLLFDYCEPGSGKQFDWKSFGRPPDRPWILAGGLTPENIQDAISLLEPDGVDVSTGVENSVVGEKDPNKIRDFITAARQL